MNDQILFSIIIANYNKGDNIRPLLASVYDQAPLHEMEVLFMDDASTDASVQVAEQFPVKIYRGARQRGPATLRNRAAREARGEYLLFMDSDVILPPGSLARFKELCLAGGFGAVSGLEVLPPVIDNWIGWFRTLQVQDNFGRYRMTEGPMDGWGTTLGAVRRELFFRAGGFNEAYGGADVEDHELALKLKDMEPMIFSPLLAYRHSYPSTLDLVVKQFRRASQMVQLKEETMLRNSLLFAWRYKAGHILSAALVAVAGASLINYSFVPLLAGLFLMKVYLNRFLFIQSFKQKGTVFMAYAFYMSLVMGVSIVLGAFCGKMRQALP